MKTDDSVSVADVFQAIQGTKFPATKEDLLEAVQDKYDTGLFSDEALDRIATFIEECDPELIRNTAKLAETVKDWNDQHSTRKYKNYKPQSIKRQRDN